MKKVSTALTSAIFMVLILSSGVTFGEGAEVMTDKDKMAQEGEICSLQAYRILESSSEEWGGTLVSRCRA
jgi:hypothetical protein